MRAYILSKQIKRKHPELMQELGKNNKSGILENLFEYIIIFITCLIPIVNVLLFFVTLFNSEEVEHRTLQRIQKKIERDE
jgi:hypothetical protein